VVRFLLEPGHRFALGLAINRVALHEHVEVDALRLELRASHAGKLALAVDQPRQPPHMPVPSIMIGFRLTIVQMFAFRVTSATAFIMGMGPTASTRSMCVPWSINWRSLSVPNPLSA
jgi:hypothetical protein